MINGEHRLVRVMIAIGLGLAVVVGLYVVGATSAVVPTPQLSLTQKPAKDWIADLILQGNEVPQGWRVIETRVENIPGAEARIIGFYNVSARNLSWVSFNEEPMIYSSNNAAAQGYNEQLKAAFTASYSSDLKPMPEYGIPLHADEIKSACLPVSLNNLSVLSCNVVARYQNVVVKTYGNVVEGRWLTMSDFQAVVEAVDQRITMVLSQQR
jgi:hypothetical protein